MSSTCHTILRTPRLTLTLLDPEKDDNLTFGLSCLNDPTAHARMGDLGSHTVPQYVAVSLSTQLLPEHTPSKQPTDRPAQYIIKLGPDDPEGERIGIISLGSREYGIPPDIGWMMLGTHQGKGYATEAARAVLSYFMDSFQGGLRNAEPPLGIIAFPLLKNRESVRVAEKIGLVPMGRLDSGDGAGANAVYGTTGVGINGGKPFDSGQKLNFYGPGKAGQRAKEMIEGATTLETPISAGIV